MMEAVTMVVERSGSLMIRANGIAARIAVWMTKGFSLIFSELLEK